MKLIFSNNERLEIEDQVLKNIPFFDPLLTGRWPIKEEGVDLRDKSIIAFLKLIDYLNGVQGDYSYYYQDFDYYCINKGKDKGKDKIKIEEFHKARSAINIELNPYVYEINEKRINYRYGFTNRMSNSYNPKMNSNKIEFEIPRLTDLILPDCLILSTTEGSFKENALYNCLESAKFYSNSYFYEKHKSYFEITSDTIYLDYLYKFKNSNKRFCFQNSKMLMIPLDIIRPFYEIQNDKEELSKLENKYYWGFPNNTSCIRDTYSLIVNLKDFSKFYDGELGDIRCNLNTTEYIFKMKEDREALFQETVKNLRFTNFKYLSTKFNGNKSNFLGLDLHKVFTNVNPIKHFTILCRDKHGILFDGIKRINVYGDNFNIEYYDYHMKYILPIKNGLDKPPEGVYYVSNGDGNNYKSWLNIASIEGKFDIEFYERYSGNLTIITEYLSLVFVSNGDFKIS